MNALVPHVPADLVDRLAKVAGLLGSEHDGERSAAAFRATALIREAGLTWAEVIRAAGPRGQRAPEVDPDTDWWARLQACLRSPAALTEWEKRFVLNLCAHGRRWAPSAKQAAILRQIFEKVSSHG